MTDIFTEDNPAAKPEADPAPVVSVQDLVGEGKKFATVDDLAKGKAESDAFINQLKDELAGVRSELEKGNNAEDNLKTLRAELADVKSKLTNVNSEPKEPTAPVLDEEQLEALVSGVITKNEQTRTANQNLAAANTAMVKQFGSVEKATEVFKSKAEAIGMSSSDLKALAAKSPSAFFHLVDIKPEGDPSNKQIVDLQDNQVNSAVLPQSTPGAKPGTAEYYNQLRREMGNQKFFADKTLMKEIWTAKKAGTYDS